MTHNIDAMVDDIRNMLTFVQTERPNVWKLAQERAWNWYPETTKTAEDCAELFGISVIQSAGIIAAFSIRTHWVRNIQDVFIFLNGGKTYGLSVRNKKAQGILDLGVDATIEDVARILNGKKIKRFFHNVLFGNRSWMATIDTWMCRIMHISKEKVGRIKGLYEAAEQAVMIVAAELMMPVPVAQAFMWICVRGRAD
jgi:hypothetical protein